MHLTGEKAGVWKDFGTGSEGGDLIDLWMKIRKKELPSALDDIRRWLGVERPKPYKAPKIAWKRPPKPKCRPPEGRAFMYLTEDRNLPPGVLQAYRLSASPRACGEIP